MSASMVAAAVEQGSIGGRVLTERSTSGNTRWPGPIVFALVGSCYFGVAQLVIALLNPYGQGAAFWPAAGLAVGALLRLPTRQWPWAVAGIAAAELAGGTSHGYELKFCVMWAAANAVEPWVGSWVVRRFTNSDRYLVPARNCLIFIAGAAIVGPVVGATIGGLAGTPSGSSFWVIFAKWLVGDGLGVLVVAPFLLALNERWSTRSYVEQGALLALIAGIPWTLVQAWDPAWDVSLPALGIPLLTWAALRHGVRVTTCAIVLMTQISNWSSVFGVGPFTPDERAFTPASLQLYLGITSATALLLAALVADLVDRSDFEQALRFQAFHDPLTGLPNRAHLNEVLDGRWPSDGPVTLLACDLDHLKHVNDNHGHHAGDHYLVTAVERIQNCLRSSDVLIRQGGDEFVVIVPELAPDEADRLAQRICDTVAEPLTFRGASVMPSVSIGIATQLHGEDLELVLRDADAALYDAKSAGRGRIARADQEQRIPVGRQSQLRRDAPQAIDNGEVEFAFQPQVDLITGRLFGAEALVRWQHPTVGTVAPEHFLPALHRGGQSNQLFLHALTYALRVQRSWTAQLGAVPSVTVNLSAGDLDVAGLAESVERAMDTFGCDPTTVWIEVTEADIASPNASRALADLSRVGVSLAIDDFGVGWSSLSRLANGPWQAIKLDGSFVQAIDGQANAVNVLQTMIDLAHSLGLVAIAEGIETDRQLAVVRELGCDVAQGFLLGRPVTPAELSAGLGADLRWLPGGLADRRVS